MITSSSSAPSTLAEAQQHDHIWLDINGQGWAIESIDGPVFHLWRGYEPHIERLVVTITNVNWSDYCDAAVAMLEAAYGDLNVLYVQSC